MRVICHVMNTDIDAFWNLYTAKEFEGVETPDYMYVINYTVDVASDIAYIFEDMQQSTFLEEEVENNFNEFFAKYLKFESP